MSTKFERIQERLVKTKLERDFVKSEIESSEYQLKSLKRTKDELNDVHSLFLKAAEDTQAKFEDHLNYVVSTALSSVFDEVYEFKLEFREKRGKTEAEILLVKNGETIKPVESVGGGVLDITSFALRLAFWSLTKETRPLLVLDEPFKHLSSGLQSKAAEMLKTLSNKLGIQMIIISHIKQLIEGGDKVFNVRIENGVSHVDSNKKEV
jgi:DNA repair exonuclease SbcCD ATPase subunit